MGPVITRSNDVISGYQLRGTNKRQVLIIKNHYRAYIGLTVSGSLKYSCCIQSIKEKHYLCFLIKINCYSNHV